VLKNITEHRAILSIAIPMILSNITVPLLGLVDTAVIAHQPEAYFLGGVAVGSMIITLFLWLAGFLRMATSGLSAQAYGAQSNERIFLVLARGLSVSLLLGLTLILLQKPIIHFGLQLAGGSNEVTEYARQYANIRIWAFPAALANLVFMGWFLGLHQAKTVMWLVIMTNLINLILDLWFVLGLGWQVRGVAWATLIADYVTSIIALYAALHYYWKLGGKISSYFHRILYWPELARYLSLNRDILIRTLCLELCFAFITFQGARMGDVVVAANAILLNFLMLISFGLDGIAFAAEARVGKAAGARDMAALRLSVRLSAYWTGGFAIIYSLFFYGLGFQVIDLISSIQDVNDYAKNYLVWIYWLPVVACWCYLLDGIYIGLTKGREMRNSMLVATFGGFFPIWYVFQGYGNHALWAAMLVFMAMRGVTLGWGLKNITSDNLVSQDGF